jgi:TPR repeat protein
MQQIPQLDREQIAILVERGKHLIASGDLAAARVVLRRAAESKDAEAALVLGSTYDPVILRELKTFGVASDLEMARGWYEKAKELGSEEAQRRIQILARSGS